MQPSVAGVDMAKQESTAINDLIHLVQGRIIDHGEDVAHDHLFVTAPPAHAMPAPLPRRRAPNATPPAVPIEDYADDDSETQVDPHAMARFAAGSAPQQLPQPQPMPQPILPQYAYPTPAPLPPMPYHASVDATERVAQYDPLPAMEWHARQAPPPRSAGPFDRLETVRVAALPPPAAEPEPGTAGELRELRAILSQLALPFAGLAVVMMFVGGYVVHNGQGGHKREVPIVMTVSPPAVESPPAPVASPVPEAAAGAAVVPVAEVAAVAPVATVAPVAEVAAEPTSEVVAAADVAADADAEAEIEMAPTTVVKHHRASKRSSSRSSSSSSSSRRRAPWPASRAPSPSRSLLRSRGAAPIRSPSRSPSPRRPGPRRRARAPAPASSRSPAARPR
ncbi:MAG: hypothetical protein IPQ07_28325 [Myxococcales bacterium]|nr:hypothetical protein [Myxococcales bacterium]